MTASILDDKSISDQQDPRSLQQELGTLGRFKFKSWEKAEAEAGA